MPRRLQRQSRLFEMFAVTSEFKELMRQKGVDSAALKAVACEQGMIDLFEDGIEKVLQGVTSLAEVLDVAG